MSDFDQSVDREGAVVVRDKQASVWKSTSTAHCRPARGPKPERSEGAQGLSATITYLFQSYLN